MNNHQNHIAFSHSGANPVHPKQNKSSFCPILSSVEANQNLFASPQVNAPIAYHNYQRYFQSPVGNAHINHSIHQVYQNSFQRDSNKQTPKNLSLEGKLI